MKRYFSWYYASFLNKVCIVLDPQLDLSPDGEATDPWSLCTVDQVEELKALLKVVQILLTGAVLAINISQSSFPVLQANTMDRHISSTFEIPAASFGIFVVISVLVVAVLKGVRRSITVKNGHSDDPKGVIPMSTVWLLPQNCLTGFAEALNAIDQNEFYISEFPRSMSSIAASLIGLVLSSWQFVGLNQQLIGLVFKTT
ncbi:hypothetical protein CQW23_23578 [Capsicum baccatum]|uniref:Uncharacterized protein n=1 Tax=Capsicum baccatum TaxID=33114 RepID=A0A2G2VSD0_CAPBA|nr:hypothetical protein CQW23_23578 [Capsicum baccatum]